MLGELRELARKEGLVIHPHKTRPFYLRTYGFEPATVFDVGVFEGTPWLYDSFPDAHFVLIDPQGDLPGPRPAKGDFHAVAVGSAPGQMTLTIPETKPGQGGAMASLLERRDALAGSFTDTKTRDVPVVTLDSLATGHVGPFGIKIDTEGFEAQVLAGATETLKQTDFVILELSMARRFEGVDPPSAAIATLAAHGLEMRDVLAIADGPTKRSQPRHMDLLFTRWDAA
ncbi:FkbM family methyltransferase [uncultured Tateyamaria sp.]|uniref:FkbM family methyltransferase n=1 Tax=Tateyamaria sp. 1078 TaxID=3417464 RepID=UPI0026269D94|nr:FkbM family methyltransferase [uncultured Tateyamaria sp.]